MTNSHQRFIRPFSKTIPTRQKGEPKKIVALCVRTATGSCYFYAADIINTKMPFLDHESTGGRVAIREAIRIATNREKESLFGSGRTSDKPDTDWDSEQESGGEDEQDDDPNGNSDLNNENQGLRSENGASSSPSRNEDTTQE